jgi:hypothetical protein
VSMSVCNTDDSLSTLDRFYTGAGGQDEVLYIILCFMFSTDFFAFNNRDRVGTKALITMTIGPSR